MTDNASPDTDLALGSQPTQLAQPTADAKRMAALKGKFDLEDEELMEDSMSGSSEDFDDILDEQLGEKLKE